MQIPELLDSLIKCIVSGTPKEKVLGWGSVGLVAVVLFLLAWGLLRLVGV